MVDGKPTPISYNIIGGQLVGMLANPDRHALYLALNSQSNEDGGAIEVQLPRNFIDSKTANNTDKDYVVVMDGDRIAGEQVEYVLEIAPTSLIVSSRLRETARKGF